jgi:hypothetical protein
MIQKTTYEELEKWIQELEKQNPRVLLINIMETCNKYV